MADYSKESPKKKTEDKDYNMDSPCLDIKELESSINIVDLLDKNYLGAIGEQVVKGYMVDEESRADWKTTVDQAMELTKSVSETKNHPWPGAANVKYPLISNAAMDYAARTMPEIIQNEKVVKAAITGEDPEGLNYAKADRVGRFMSYQLLIDSTDWQDGLGKLLQLLPIVGTAFKKTYYNTLEKKNVSELCVPDKIVVNYGIQSLEKARRITHIIEMYENDIIERQRAGIYCEDIDPDSLYSPETDASDPDRKIELLEQHCWLDLDGDDYAEPYIVICEKHSRQVLRIVNRFKHIKRSDNKILCIEPEHYFTDFHFIHSSDGGFYSMGFGALLLPLNATINTLLNQLLDSGTLSITQCGFISRGLRLKSGEFRLKMGEWKVLDTTQNVDIGKSIFKMPVTEPSPTLFKLLELLIQTGKEMSSNTDALQGNLPAQNVATGTINQLVEQGTKVFTSINKRVYRSLKKEFQKLYDLNCQYLNNKEYREVMASQDIDVKEDFKIGAVNVHPVADPMISSAASRVQKAQLISGLPTVDKRAADMFALETMHMDKATIEKLLPPIPENQPPPPETQKIMAEISLMQAKMAEMATNVQKTSMEMQLAMQELELKKESQNTLNMESQARVWKMGQDAAHGAAKLTIASGKMESQEALKAEELSHKNDIAQAQTMLQARDRQTQAYKVAADVKIKEVEAGIKNKEANAKLSAAEKKGGVKDPKGKTPKFDYEDIEYTAKLKGMTIAEVKELLGVK